MVTQESRVTGSDPKKRPVQERTRPLTTPVDPCIGAAPLAGPEAKPFDDDDPYADVPCTD